MQIEFQKNNLTVERTVFIVASEMRELDTRVHLSYKDVLLVPYDDDCCTIKSRKHPDISSEICPSKRLNIPLVSSPMDSITKENMIVALDEQNALGIYTRLIGDADETTKQITAMKKVRKYCKGDMACAIGVNNEKTFVHVQALCDAGVDIICIDIANGNHIYMKEALAKIIRLKDLYPLSIIAGNIATSKAALRLADWGADAVRVGIGSGAPCTTRRVIGFGVPQFTAIMDCAPPLKSRNVKVIADGGVRCSGDVCKAIWAGADTVMMGYVFAGHDECPTYDRGKIYRGMSSRTVHQRDDVAAEGVSVRIENKGSVVNLINEYAMALKSALSMGNASNLDEFRQNVRAIRVSTMSNEESEPVNEMSA